jgi:hypothetical protein
MAYPSSIGRPLCNVRAYIVDPIDVSVLLAPGVPGELVVAGQQVARGYRNLPEQTAGAFVCNPFVEDGARAADSAYRRMYRTGDLCRWLPDGTLGFMGRIDQQVKLRGFRIELGEIENVLLQHPSVVACAVSLCSGSRGSTDQFLAAYIELATRPTGGDIDDFEQDGSSVELALDLASLREGLREHCSKQLPEYMVPSSTTVLTTMPKLPSGKINRKALPSPSSDDKMATGTYVAPRTVLESQLAGLFQEVLQLERAVGVDDDFFRLGGSSLAAVRLVGLVRNATGLWARGGGGPPPPPFLFFLPPRLPRGRFRPPFFFFFFAPPPPSCGCC